MNERNVARNYLDLLQRIVDGPNLLESVITCDEIWIFQYYPETKRQSMQWESAVSPRQKEKKHTIRSKFKAQLSSCWELTLPSRYPG